MDSPDQRAAVSRIVTVLRSATRIVKIAPFLYVLIFAIYMMLSTFVSDGVLCVMDSIFMVSPAVSGLLLVLSRIFRLCKWHIAACLIPTSSSVESFVDSFVITFTSPEVIAINVILGVASLLFLVTADRRIYGRKKASV